MIVGIGIDTTTVSRVEKVLEKDNFKTRFYSDSELFMLAKRGNKAQTYAVNYAGKEAFGKALGTGLIGFEWNELSILRTEAGAPYCAYSGKLKELMEKNHWKAKVSFTHEGDYASAVVIIEEQTKA